MNNVEFQAMITSCKKYDSFKNRQGKEIPEGTSVLWHIPYDNDDDLGFKSNRASFSNEKRDIVYNSFKGMKFPCYANLRGHTDYRGRVHIDEVKPIK